jgi:ATP synthase protein I
VSAEDEFPQQKVPKPLPSAAAFLGMGLSAAVCVAIGVVLGLWLDDKFHTAPILLLVGLALGLVTAIVSVIKQIRTYL